ADLPWPPMEGQPTAARPDRYERADGTRNAARDGVRRPVREADWPWSTPEPGWEAAGEPVREPASAPSSAPAGTPGSGPAWSPPGSAPAWSPPGSAPAGTPGSGP